MNSKSPLVCVLSTMLSVVTLASLPQLPQESTTALSHRVDHSAVVPAVAVTITHSTTPTLNSSSDITVQVLSTETITDARVSLIYPSQIRLDTIDPSGSTAATQEIIWDHILLEEGVAQDFDVTFEASDPIFGAFLAAVTNSQFGDEWMAGTAAEYIELDAAGIRIADVPLVGRPEQALAQKWDINPFRIEMTPSELPTPSQAISLTIAITNTSTTRTMSYSAAVAIPDGWSVIGQQAVGWTRTLLPSQSDLKVFSLESGTDYGEWTIELEIADSVSTGFRMQYSGSCSEEMPATAMIGSSVKRYSTGSTNVPLKVSPSVDSAASLHIPDRIKQQQCDVQYTPLRGWLKGKTSNGNQSLWLNNTLVELRINPSDPMLVSQCPAESWVRYANTSDGYYYLPSVPRVAGTYQITSWATDDDSPDGDSFSVKVFSVISEPNGDLRSEAVKRLELQLTGPPQYCTGVAGMCMPLISQECEEGDLDNCDCPKSYFIQHHISSAPAPFADNHFASAGFDSREAGKAVIVLYPSPLAFANARGITTERDGRIVILIKGNAPRWTVLNHEYGHYVQFMLNDGEMDGLTCSWKEGWAHLLAGVRSPFLLAAWGDGPSYGHLDPGAGDSCNGVDQQPGGVRSIELAIAAALSDMIDGVNETEADSANHISVSTIGDVVGGDKPACAAEFLKTWIDSDLPQSAAVEQVFDNVGIQPGTNCPND